MFSRGRFRSGRGSNGVINYCRARESYVAGVGLGRVGSGRLCPLDTRLNLHLVAAAEFAAVAAPAAAAGRDHVTNTSLADALRSSHAAVEMCQL
jgi:hypothetical protein